MLDYKEMYTSAPEASIAQLEPEEKFQSLSVCLFFLCPLQDIIHADLIKVSQGAQHPRRDHSLAGFIVGVSPLRNIDSRAHLGLSQVSVLPQITDLSVSYHCDHPITGYVRTICSIDFLNILF